MRLILLLTSAIFLLSSPVFSVVEPKVVRINHELVVAYKIVNYGFGNYGLLAVVSGGSLSGAATVKVAEGDDPEELRDYINKIAGIKQ
jgi:hypothetical protein